MFNLILKDLLVLKKAILFSVVYILVIIFTFQQVGPAAYPTGVVAFTYMLLLSVCAYEDKNESDILLNSLPLKKSTIVLSKYIVTFTFFLLGSMYYVIVCLIINSLGLPIKVYPPTPEGFAAAALAVTLLNSIYLPVFFKVGYMRSKILNFIIFFAFFFSTGFLGRALVSNKDSFIISTLINISQSLPEIMLVTFLIGVIFLFMFISYLISLQLYRNRDF